MMLNTKDGQFISVILILWHEKLERCLSQHCVLIFLLFLFFAFCIKNHDAELILGFPAIKLNFTDFLICDKIYLALFEFIHIYRDFFFSGALHILCLLLLE